MARIAINGFGRIGRATFKAGWGKPGFKVVAINDLTDAKTLAYLLKHDSVYGRWSKEVKATKNSIIIDGTEVPVLSQKDPLQLPWDKMEIDVVTESTGIFRTEEKASMHISAGAKRVIISAPAKGGNVPTRVISVNDIEVKDDSAKVINNASCTTNCVAPVTAIIHEAFGVEKALMTTIHAYTSTQNLIDGPHKDLRRARAAAINMIPTSTGAAIATTQTIPDLEGKFDGLAVRVPIPVSSLSDITFLLSKDVTVEEVHKAFKKAVKTARFAGVVRCTEEPIVSTDIVGDPHSAIVDFGLTRVVGGNLLKVVAWYDNEWGYAHRLAEMALKF